MCTFYPFFPGDKLKSLTFHHSQTDQIRTFTNTSTVHLCDCITDNVDKAGRCVATTGRVGRGTPGADDELLAPAGSRGNGGRVPADNCATAADS